MTPASIRWDATKAKASSCSRGLGGSGRCDTRRKVSTDPSRTTRKASVVPGA